MSLLVVSRAEADGDDLSVAVWKRVARERRAKTTQAGPGGATGCVGWGLQPPGLRHGLCWAEGRTKVGKKGRRRSNFPLRHVINLRTVHSRCAFDVSHGVLPATKRPFLGSDLRRGLWSHPWPVHPTHPCPGTTRVIFSVDFGLSLFLPHKPPNPLAALASLLVLLLADLGLHFSGLRLLTCAGSVRNARSVPVEKNHLLESSQHCTDTASSLHGTPVPKPPRLHR
ncbi:uncharacterized protein IWZ02DRAFT_289803 [Phyllosticta citriasiana]|uniref:uncharacterized protein n=1 Tax=Phyllosticta citriasiana TaxID=595635 RepID=UPI0030FDE9DB